MRRPTTGPLLALLLSGGEALANGRFPAANQLVVSPQRTLIRTTFGLLISDGGPFSWVCEGAIPLSDDQDPPVALFAGGRVAVAPLAGIKISDEAACALSPAQGIPPGELPIDVSAERGDPSRGVAVTWQAQGKVTRIYGTSDGGLGWQLRGELPEKDGVPTTLDAAPSRPSRLAVAGSFSREMALWGYVSVSDDGGATWSRSETPLGGDKGLFLSAIDPQDPDLLYFRTSGGESDRLLASSDGGKTLTELTRVSGAMPGFALSPDGSRVAVGGPGAGLLVGARGSTSFARVRAGPTGCLAWSEQGLFACGPGLGGDFVLGRSGDEGATFSPVLARMGDIEGPSARCAAGSAVEAACGPLWPAQQSTLAAIGQAGAAGSGGAAGGGQAGTAGGAGAAPEAPGEEGCGCRGAGRGGEGGWWAALLALAAGATARAGWPRRRVRQGEAGTRAASQPGEAGTRAGQPGG